MKGRISINSEVCKGCMYCVLHCPKGVISVSESFNKSGTHTATPTAMKKCNGCGICALMCPDIAIQVWKENSN